MYRPDIPSLQSCHEGHEKLHTGEEKKCRSKSPTFNRTKASSSHQKNPLTIDYLSYKVKVID